MKWKLHWINTPLVWINWIKGPSKTAAAPVDPIDPLSKLVGEIIRDSLLLRGCMAAATRAGEFWAKNTGLSGYTGSAQSFQHVTLIQFSTLIHRALDQPQAHKHPLWISQLAAPVLTARQGNPAIVGLWTAIRSNYRPNSEISLGGLSPGALISWLSPPHWRARPRCKAVDAIFFHPTPAQ
jgi:hypothetical protein